MLNKFIERVLGKIYKYHRIRYERYESEFYNCIWSGRDLSVCDRYLHKAVKHEKWCDRIDGIIYSLGDPA